MRTSYSKPLDDIAIENDLLKTQGEALLAKQSRANAVLATCPDRERCVLCGSVLAGTMFKHRVLSFVQCGTCSHIQSKAQPPAAYPECVHQESTFSTIYPDLSDDAYADRKSRVYRPKLDWVLAEMAACDSAVDPQALRWLEIGSGAGYFLSCLEDVGCGHVVGVEAEATLANIAGRHLHTGQAVQHDAGIESAIQAYPADVIVAFFVFEHVSDFVPVMDALASVPAGTWLVFSVPLYGYSCVIEDAFPEVYARNLDGAVHTQLFTDESIAFALARSGFSAVAEWVFGQDAQDLCRVLAGRMRKCPGETAFALRNMIMSVSQDAIQAALDRERLSDQRHILARKVSS